MSTVFGIDSGLFISEAGLGITAVAALVGIWIDRDPDRPLRYSVWLTVLVVLATGVGVFQTYQDYLSGEKLQGDIARVLQKVDKIAHEGTADVPVLNEVLKNEVAAQARNNPDVMAAIAQRVADEGGDPQAVLTTYLPDNEVKAFATDGRLTTAPLDAKIANLDGRTESPIRHPSTFGTGEALLRTPTKKGQTRTEKNP